MKFTIEEEYKGMLIREYLREVQGLSRRILIAAKAETNGILVNGAAVTVRYTLQENDKLEVNLPPEKISKWLRPEKMKLSVIYEDASILVLNKQAGMPTLPSPLYKAGTIANGLLGYYQQIGHSGTVHIVTRLDRDTSGVILIAKDRLAHSLFSKQQNQYKIKRKYQVIVEGVPEEKKGKIDAPIARKTGSIIEREVSSGGQRAVTYYKVLKSWKDYSLLEVELETGRTHQIRVHFSYLGCPLSGDTLYGGSKAIINRQALHCESLTLEHPFTKELHTFHAEPPKDFQIAIEA